MSLLLLLERFFPGVHSLRLTNFEKMFLFSLFFCDYFRLVYFIRVHVHECCIYSCVLIFTSYKFWTKTVKINVAWTLPLLQYLDDFPEKLDFVLHPVLYTLSLNSQEQTKPQLSLKSDLEFCCIVSEFATP